VLRAQPASAQASRHIQAEQERRRDRQELVIFAIRLAAAIVFLLVAYWLLARLRERNTRYLPLAAAAVGFATIFAFVVAVDYLTDYFDPFDLGLLFLSLLGVLATLVAFWVLQRYLRRRLPLRRVRKRECPYCGFPVRGNARCEGCGREVIAACARCSSPRRVGTPFCGACGAA
jgi:flagellar biogenesis protein FliO